MLAESSSILITEGGSASSVRRVDVHLETGVVKLQDRRVGTGGEGREEEGREKRRQEDGSGCFTACSCPRRTMSSFWQSMSYWETLKV